MISIIIPTYNRVGELKRCLESVIPQHYPGLEVIVVDDGSTDGTRAWLETMQRQYDFIQTIYNTTNAGVNYSRNRGIEKAAGKYILFLDSDEQLLPDSLSGIRDTLQTNGHCKHFLFLQADRQAHFEHLLTLRPVNYEDWIRGDLSGDFIHVIAASIMKKYLFFEQFRMFEYLNWLRISKETAPQLLAPVVVAERETGRSDSLTASARLKSLPAMNAQFESKQLYYAMYGEDLQRYHQRSFRAQLLKVIMLGVACNRKAECRNLIRYANRLHIRLAGSLLLLIPSRIVRKGILTYTVFK